MPQSKRFAGLHWSVWFVSVLLTAAPTAFADGINRGAVQAAPFSWTGFYVGVNAGYGWADVDQGWTNVSNPGADSPAAIAARQSQSAGSFNLNAFTGGVTAGYNAQVGTLVAGFETDINSLHASQSRTQAVTGFPGNTITQSASFDWFFTVRGRLGLAWDRSLFYVTGGFAGTAPNYADSSVYPGSTMATSDSGRMHTGWTLGTGIEHALSRNWTVKVEYLYTDLGADTTLACNSLVTTHCYSFKHDLTLSTARLGINYKF